MRIADKAYAAGILDGEGSICLTRWSSNRWNNMYPVVAVSNCDEPLIHWLNSRWKGSIRIGIIRSGSRRPQHRWSLSGLKTNKFLNDVIPYLIIKKERANWALQANAIQGSKKLFRPYSERDKDKIMAIRVLFDQDTAARIAAQRGYNDQDGTNSA